MSIKTKLSVLSLVTAVALGSMTSAQAFRAIDENNVGVSNVAATASLLKADGRVGALTFSGDFSSLVSGLGSKLGVTGLAVRRVDADKLGFKHVRIAQTYKGLPVIGSDMVININDAGDVYRVGGRFQPALNISTKPSISAKGAVAAAGEKAASVISAPSLVVYAGRLAYQLRTAAVENGNIRNWQYYIDATDGAILSKYDDIKRLAAPSCASGSYQNVQGVRLADEDGSVVSMEGFQDASNYNLYNCGSGATVGNWGISDEDTSDWVKNATADFGAADPAAISAAKNMEDTQDFVLNTDGRNSFNNAGAFAEAQVHVGNDYVNAYWNGSGLFFGDGDGVLAGPLTVLDIVGHEFGHAITQYTSNLVYQNESGALNESFSDIIGAAIEFDKQPDGTAAYPNVVDGQSDYLMGEDSWLQGVALRNLREPQLEGQPSCYKGSLWYSGNGDNGGVHYNSGVQNWVYYAAAEGGSGTNDGNAYNITGIGQELSAAIANRVNTVYLSSSSDYADARAAWSVAAADLGDAATVAAVEAAWTAAWCDNGDDDGGDRPRRGPRRTR